MEINVNHPSVIKFLSDITQNIVSNVSVESYFELSEEKKFGVSYAVLKLIKATSENRVKLGELEFRALLSALWKKNEENENYEVAAILNHINKNYDSLKEMTAPKKRTRREPKTDKINNGE